MVNFLRLKISKGILPPFKKIYHLSCKLSTIGHNTLEVYIFLHITTSLKIKLLYQDIICLAGDNGRNISNVYIVMTQYLLVYMAIFKYTSLIYHYACCICEA